MTGIAKVKGIKIDDSISRTFIIICDIDNCFADSRAMGKYVPKDATSREGWDIFGSHFDECKPNKHVVDFISTVADTIPIYFMSAREDRFNIREITTKQIETFSNGRIKMGEDSSNRLLLRREFDYRPSAIVKEDMLISIVKEGYIPLLAIDDDKSNCEMFKKYEIPTNLYDIETNSMIKFYEVKNAI